MSSIDIDINDLVKERTVLNINIKGKRKFLMKLNIAKWFFIVGAKILGCGIEISESGQI